MNSDKLRAAAASAPAQIAWNLARASYSGNSFAVAFSATGLFFRADGLKMYALLEPVDAVYEYDLSTAWAVNTSAFVRSRGIGAQESAPRAVFFSPDGLKMYVMGITGDDVNEYTLSTAWNISTTTFIQAFSVAARETSPTGLYFKDNGLEMYVTGNSSDSVNKYTLSTAWDVSTAIFTQSKNISAQIGAPNQVFFKPDGLAMFVVGQLENAIFEYYLTIAWDISTATFLRSFSVGSQISNAYGLFFKPDGLKMYSSGVTPATVFEYNFS